MPKKIEESSLKKIVKKYKLLSLIHGIILKPYSFFNRKLMYPLVEKHRLKNKLKHVDKINIGCGKDIIEDWLNFGLYSDLEIPYGTIKIIDGISVLHFDATEELLIDVETVKYIYASHFIEHISFAEGITMLERYYKIMKKGGVIRFTTPDLESWVRNYYENNVNFFENYKNTCIRLNVENISLVKTKGEIFMSEIYNWGHKWNYDFESIKHVLEKAGFSQVTKKKASESLIPDIAKIESKNGGRFSENFYVEAIKE